jgi:hypothetical protein
MSNFYETEDVFIGRDENGLDICIDLGGPRIDELRKLLSRGLNTWERAPEWLLKLAEIVDK